MQKIKKGVRWLADTDRISNDNLFILKDYSTKISKVSLKKSRFKNEKDVIDFYQKESTNLEKLNKLKKNEELYESFIKYMTGKKSLPLMYDTVFKKIFDFELHSDRVKSFLTSILGFNVQLDGIVNCSIAVSENSPGVIFDILLKSVNGSLVNLEAQKKPHFFTGNRISCYIATLIVKSYNRIKADSKNKFSYENIPKSYSVIIFENTTKEFKNNNNQYVFHGKLAFNPKLEMDTLGEVYIIALDIFKECEYSIDMENIKLKKINEISEEEFKRCCELELSIWLKLLTAESDEDLNSLSQKYPWIAEIYAEMIEFMQNPEEAIDIYFSILAECDRLSMENEMEMLREDAEELKKNMAEWKIEMEEWKTELEEKKTELEEKKTELEEKKTELEEKDNTIKKLVEYLEMKKISIPEEL